VIGVVFFIGLVLLIVDGIEALRWACRGDDPHIDMLHSFGVDHDLSEADLDFLFNHVAGAAEVKK